MTSTSAPHHSLEWTTMGTMGDVCVCVCYPTLLGCREGGRAFAVLADRIRDG